MHGKSEHKILLVLNFVCIIMLSTSTTETERRVILISDSSVFSGCVSEMIGLIRNLTNQMLYLLLTFFCRSCFSESWNIDCLQAHETVPQLCFSSKVTFFKISVKFGCLSEKIHQSQVFVSFLEKFFLIWKCLLIAWFFLRYFSYFENRSTHFKTC